MAVWNEETETTSGDWLNDEYRLRPPAAAYRSFLTCRHRAYLLIDHRLLSLWCVQVKFLRPRCSDLNLMELPFRNPRTRLKDLLNKTRYFIIPSYSGLAVHRYLGLNYGKQRFVMMCPWPKQKSCCFSPGWKGLGKDICRVWKPV